MKEILATLKLLLEQSRQFNEHVATFIQAVEKDCGSPLMPAILEFIARSNHFNRQIHQAITLAMEDINRRMNNIERSQV